MVIQSNMFSKGIVEVWKITEPIFIKFKVPISGEKLETSIEPEILTNLLIELNTAVGSSNATCIDGG